MFCSFLQKLPPYPLPTHNVTVRGVIPTEFDVRFANYGELECLFCFTFLLFFFLDEL